MKLRFIISIIIVTFASNALFASNHTNDSLTCACSCQNENSNMLSGISTPNENHLSPSLSDSLSYSTALINSLNNTIAVENKYLTVISILIAVFGVVIAAVGIASFIGIKGVNKHKETTDSMIRDYKATIDNIIEGIKSELRIKISEINKLRDKNDSNYKEFIGAIDKRVDGMKGDFRDKILEFNKIKDNNDRNFNDYKREINERVDVIKTEVFNKIEEINRLDKSVYEKTKEIENLAKIQESQNQYIQRINLYLFSITNTVVDNLSDNDEKAKGIRKILYQEYYIVKAFLPWSDSREDGTEAAFRYLQHNGTKEQIEDLQFISDNDTDERKRNIALETIGYIRARLMNEQSS